jgi:ribonuclease HI
MDKKKVIIYTDGACSGNPGPGGWAAVMMYNNENKSMFMKKCISGGERNTTNNKMELKAVINGLKM